ncbi:3'(2'),5'-bisphosphate nucleotidase CysQ family protein [Legionella spiritensis]|nr:3'(2'),5'-bisphosphate nucleotidase CysQ [Legionella spiritensis]
MKIDASPLTEADRVSHEHLTSCLPRIKNIPVLSEEHPIDFDMRKDWHEFWLIDPLDGTKEFINELDDFCINIALIQDREPVLGIVYAPVLNELYYAEKNKGFEYFGPVLQRTDRQDIVVATSRFHHSQLTDDFMSLNGLTNTYAIGAAIKFGRMALGLIDIYPRFEGSKEWDTAAGQLIIKEASCRIIDLKTQEEPRYNKCDVRNNFFVAYNSLLDIKQFQFPDMS